MQSTIMVILMLAVGLLLIIGGVFVFLISMVVNPENITKTGFIMAAVGITMFGSAFIFG